LQNRRENAYSMSLEIPECVVENSSHLTGIQLYVTMFKEI